MHLSLRIKSIRSILKLFSKLIESAMLKIDFLDSFINLVSNLVLI